MQKSIILAIALLPAQFICGQNLEKLISVTEVKRVESTLSADEMQGRATFSPGIEKAADFISQEFKKAGISPLAGSNSFRQTFSMVKCTNQQASGAIDGQSVDQANMVAFSSSTNLRFNQDSGFEKISIGPGADFRSIAFKYIYPKKNCLVVVDTSFAKFFTRLNGIKGKQFKSPYSSVFVLAPIVPKQFEFRILQQVEEMPLSNIVGVLPGNTRPEEYVIFSAHYDHLGIGKPNAKGDSIYNGANDDASGSTAVILLAKYFARQKNNQRTILFATFAAEEIGGFGSQYFSRQLDPSKVVAMFNIEMIGTESKWGSNAVYMTGYDKTDMGKIIGKNLLGSKFSVHPDPYPEQELFYRSDNATLARQGVPAHSLSTSKMDDEKNYHTPGDELATLDMDNMTAVIRGLALSAGTIISGADTPSRVDIKGLK